MSLLHAEAWLAVAGAWLALAGAVAAARQLARRRLARLLGRPRRPPARSDLLLLAALAAVAVAWLGPRAGTRTVEVPATGIDVVVLVDVSRSMDARDTPPSRLARARRAAQEALGALGAGDRAALAVFAGHGALLTPLTPDKRALAALVGALDTQLMSDRGSDGAAGVRRALDAFDPASLRPRVLLLLSDGESASLGAEEARDRARELDVRVVAGLFGDEAGATIPAGSGVLEHASGRPVTTHRRREPAEALAAATGGVVLRADAFGVLGAATVDAALRAGATPTAEGTLAREVPVTRYAWPAALALALLLVEALPPGGARRVRAALGRGRARGRGRRTSRRARAGAAAAGALLLLGADADPAAERAAREAAVRARPEAADRLVALGVARARAGDPAEAERALAAAAMRAADPQLAATAYYDLGVLALEQRAWETARDAFLDALALDPHDADARRNLEWTLRALEARDPPPGGGPRTPDEGAQDAQEEGGTPPDVGPREPAGAEPAPGEQAPAETPQPRPADEEAQETGRGRGEARADAPPPLSPPEAARWLEAVEDDPGRALRRAAADQGRGGVRGGPQW